MTKPNSRQLSHQEVSVEKIDGYWCVFCGKFLESQEGVIVHDDVPHPHPFPWDYEEGLQ